jgi:hypothetical protein
MERSLPTPSFIGDDGRGDDWMERPSFVGDDGRGDDWTERTVRTPRFVGDDGRGDDWMKRPPTTSFVGDDGRGDDWMERPLPTPSFKGDDGGRGGDCGGCSEPAWCWCEWCIMIENMASEVTIEVLWFLSFGW